MTDELPKKSRSPRVSYSLKAVFWVITVTAAYFAGRIPLLNRARVAETAAATAEAELDSVLRNSEIVIGGDAYSWHSIDSLLNNAPNWQDKAAAPPLGLLDTLALCSTISETLNSKAIKTKIANWDLSALTLLPIGWPNRGMQSNRWVYSARFHGIAENEIAYSSFSAIILMDGTVLIGDNQFDQSSIYPLMDEHYDSVTN